MIIENQLKEDHAPVTRHDALACLRGPTLGALDCVTLIKNTVQPLSRSHPVNVSAHVLVGHDQHVWAGAVTAEHLF